MEMEDLALLMQKGFEEMHQKMATKSETEDLAMMVQRGFEEMDGRFKEMDNRMATKEDLRGLESRLSDKMDNLDVRLSSHISDCELRLDDLSEWHDEVDIRINKIEDRIAGIK